MDPKQSRGFRNKNPGNIDHNPNNKWLGLADPPHEVRDDGSPGRFAVFRSHEFGIRALAMLLQTYQDRHGLNTVREIINRWAPPSENVTSAYVVAVASHMGVAPTDPIDVHRPEVMRPLVEAIITHELGGNPYPVATINEGLRLAGIVQPGVANTGTMKAAQVTAVAGVGAASVAQVAEMVTTNSTGLASLVTALGPWFVVVALLGAIAFILWRQNKRKQEIIG